MTKKEQMEFLPEERERGKNIHLKISFYRHAEKTHKGRLSKIGFIHAKRFGTGKEIPKDGIKVYASPFQRTRDTAEQIIKGVKEQNEQQRTFTSRIRLELAPPDWKHFDIIRQRAKEIEAKEGQAGLFRYILSEPLAQEDLEHWTSGLAYLVDRYRRMTDRLYSNSDIELMHVTHDMVIADFLRKVAVFKNKEGERINIDNLDAIGGPVKFLEGFSLEIDSDEKGEKQIKIVFRDKEFEVDETKLKELVDKFKKQPYKGRATKQDYKQKT